MRTASPKAIVVLVAIGVICSLILYAGAAKQLSSRGVYVAAGLIPAPSMRRVCHALKGEGRSKDVAEPRPRVPTDSLANEVAWPASRSSSNSHPDLSASCPSRPDPSPREPQQPNRAVPQLRFST